ncbi:MAG: enoyl-CoA hydratase/isomerase family protein, partial [Betaproteobacteria bacterium]|nr:enoyl-CoA hydratase/isomerase family protein [Betaproteobacteria bacterium]
MNEERDILKVSTENKVCLLMLNRPERRNALSRQMNAEIRSAILAADVDPEVSLIAITGAGAAFCSGADLKDARATDTSGGRFRGPLPRPDRTVFEILLE